MLDNIVDKLNRSSIKADILTLNDGQQANVLSYISEILSLSPVSITDCREARFSKGKACPHCDSHEICKYGITCGKQRYKCKSCRRTFTDLSKSVLSSSKLPLEDWLEYFKDDKEILKGKNILLQTVASQLELNIEDYRTRTALFR